MSFSVPTTRRASFMSTGFGLVLVVAQAVKTRSRRAMEVRFTLRPPIRPENATPDLQNYSELRAGRRLLGVDTGGRRRLRLPTHRDRVEEHRGDAVDPMVERLVVQRGRGGVFVLLLDEGGER